MRDILRSSDIRHTDGILNNGTEIAAPAQFSATPASHHAEITAKYFVDAARAGKPVNDLDLARWYIKHFKLLRICRFELLDNNIKRLTICHTWRIERYPDHRVLLYVFDLQRERWQQTDNLSDLPHIPFFSQGLNWVYDCLKRACGRAFEAAQIKIPGCKTDVTDVSGEYNIAKIAGTCFPVSFDNGARALRATLWEHFIDRDVYSAICVMAKTTPTLLHYLSVVPYRSSLQKVAREHRNLLPVLRLIAPQSWYHDDLFSKKLWHRPEHHPAPIDNYPFKLHPCDQQTRIAKQSLQVITENPISFADVRTWNWLRQAPVPIVRLWVEGEADPKLVTVLSQVGEVRAPVIAWMRLFNIAYRLRNQIDPARIQQTVRFARLYLQESARIWQADGFNAVKQWVKNSTDTLKDLFDWLEAEGFAQGQPGKNATWISMKRRSDDWHRRIAIENRQNALDNERLFRWQSLLTKMVIDGVVFESLDDVTALQKEGYEMNHCIASYGELCHEGKYRVFRVTEPDGTRSTLGIGITCDKKRKAVIDQHRGRYNDPVSEAASKAARQLCHAYSLRLKSHDHDN